jgi:hypothetical protein
MKDLDLTTGRGGHSVNTSSRMSVIDGGRYIKLFPSQAIVDKMKAAGWVMANARLRSDDDDNVVGILLKKSGTGVKIRYRTDGRHECPSIPVPTKNIGKAVVTEGTQVHGECKVEEEGDDFLFHIREGITFAKGDDDVR